MTVRLIGIADLHINERLRFEEGAEIRRWMVNTLPAYEPDAYLIGGDLLHGRSTIAEREAAMRFLRALDHDAEVVGVYGNHEAKDDLGIYNALPRTRFYQEPTIHVLPGVVLACLPWLRYAPAATDLHLPPAKLAEIMVAQLAGRIEALRVELAETMVENEDMPRVMLGHAMIRGAKTALGQPIPIGSEFELGLDDLASFGCDAYLFGHVHAGQEWRVNVGAPVVYPGSPHRTTYGEIDEKRVALIVIEGRDARVEYIPTPARPMFLAEILWTPAAWEGDAAVEQLLGDVEDATIPPDIRLRYSVPASRREQGTADAARLVAKLKKAGAFAVKPEPVVITEATSREAAAEVVRAATLAEQVALLLHRQGKDTTSIDRLLGRLTKLQTKDTR